MGANYFTATGVAVTPDWTVLATEELGAAYTGRTLSFEVKNAGTVGSDDDLTEFEVQIRPHANGSWFTYVEAADIQAATGRVTRRYSPALEVPAGSISPSASMHVVVNLEPIYAVRVRARTASGSTTADIHGFVESDEPWADGVAKSLFGPNTILAADTDDTPAALTVAEQRHVGRITGGNIVDLTPSQSLGILANMITVQRISGQYYDGTPYGGVHVGTDYTLVADELTAIPFLSFGETWDEIGLEIMGADAGKGIKLGIYEMGTGGAPGDLLYAGAARDISTIGFKSNTSIAQATSPGWCFVALLSDSNVATVESQNRLPLGIIGASSGAAISAKGWTKAAQAYAAGLPDPFPGTPTQYIAGRPSRILMAF